MEAFTDGGRRSWIIGCVIVGAEALSLLWQIEEGTLRSLLKGGLVDVYVDDYAVISERWRGRRDTMRS